MMNIIIRFPLDHHTILGRFKIAQLGDTLQ